MNLRFGISLLVVLISIGSPKASWAQKKGKKGEKVENELSLENIWGSNKYFAESLGHVVPLPNGQYLKSDYTRTGGMVVVRYDFEREGPRDTIFNSEFVRGWSPEDFVSDFQISSDQQFLLLAVNPTSIYRHSYTAKYYVYHLAKNRFKVVMDGKQLSNATFSPDNSKIAFTHENNVYYFNFKTDALLQITTDGKKNSIINGEPDWVYEEEFTLKVAFAWSPLSDKIAYLKFDESAVPEYQIPTYDFRDAHAKPLTYKYPKAGDPVSKVSLHIFDLSSNKTVKVDVGPDADQFIPRIKWTNDNATLAYLKLNHRQNNLDVMFASTSTGASRSVFNDKSDTYIEIVDIWYFLKDNSFFFPSERTGFNCLFHVKPETGESTNLTNFFRSDISELIAVDEANNRLYYSAYDPSPIFKTTFQLNFDGKNRVPFPEDGQRGQNELIFAPDFKYYIHTSSAFLSPEVSTSYKMDVGKLFELVTNKELKERIAALNVSPIKEQMFDLGDSLKLYGWIIYPKDFSKKQKYPTIFTVYGGPGHNAVTNGWGGHNDIYYQNLANEGYIVVCVDNRGTGGRGYSFKRKPYLQMGVIESDDIISSARVLIKTNENVDPNRVGIFGWSFGGYMALMCKFRAPDVFKAAVAVAPVTDWRFYDNIYTERYMQMPSENKAGYEKTSVFKYVKAYDEGLFLAHGTLDDNVHPQNSFALVEALVALNKPFDSEWYTNKNHGIGGGLTRLHLFSRISKHFDKWLTPEQKVKK